MMNYSRIEASVDMELLKNSHIVIVGAGGSYSLITALSRCGIGKLTVIDFDKVEPTNIVRQGYKISEVGKLKVKALKQEIALINPEVQFNAISKSVLELSAKEQNQIFRNATIILFLTDSFKAQAFGNSIALKYNKPAIFSGWSQKSRTAELFFQIPGFTRACFRCAASSRYKANQDQEIKISSNANTIFHAQLLDSIIGMITLAILHRFSEASDKEYQQFFQALKNSHGVIDYNFFHFKAHPLGGNKLFDKFFSNPNHQSGLFSSYFQMADAELITNGYGYDCPDCKGQLEQQVQESKSKTHAHGK